MGSQFIKISENYEDNIKYSVFIITILIFPLAPIIYGRVTKDQVGSIIVGVIPIVVISFYGNFILGNTSQMSRILRVIDYTGSLAIIGGLEGYFASKKRRRYILIAIFSGILWILVFLSGIN